MKASLNWIGRYVDLTGFTPEEIADKLTFAGVEVEGISYFARGTSLVIGEILACEKHPDSDHLHVLQVDEGPRYGIHQIVCGAPNARKGLKVIVAREGAELPGGKIVKSTIRGVESDGMCCALYELGVDKKLLSEKQVSGIEELDASAKVGEEEVLKSLHLDDAVLDLSLLANRPDLYSLKNVAREIACLLDRPVHFPAIKPYKAVPTSFEVGSATPKCPQFAIKEVKGITVGPSPKWLSEALASEGVRSINNVVDIGNYVMLLTGEPLNMYDLDKLRSASLIVRDDLQGKFVAMDEQAYDLIPGDLVVTSRGEPMCLAGIMTADAAKIDEKSKNVAVESAVFAYAAIRHTSNRLGLASESSLRFVKGVNPSQAEEVLDLAGSLLIDLAGAHSVSATSNYDTLSHEPKVIKTTLGYLNGRLGTHFSLTEALAAFKRDNLAVKAVGEEIITTIPSYRIDMDGEADLSEELIRILGYSHVESKLPTSELTLAGLTPRQAAKRAIRRYLREQGLDEFLTYTLVNKKQSGEFAYLNKGEPYRLKNPVTEDHEYVRTSLLPSLLLSTSYNASRQEKDLACYEISDLDSPSSQSASHLAIVLSGEMPLQGKLRRRPYDFYDAKGLLEGIMDLLGIGKSRYQIKPWSLGGSELHPGKAAEIRMGKTLLGYLGELRPDEAKRRGLSSSSVVLELDLAALLDLKVGKLTATIPPKFPSVSRDLAFVIAKDVPYEDIARELSRSDALLRKVEVFDVYEGENIAPTKKSVALTLTYRSDERTLKEEEVAAAVNKAISCLTAHFGAEIRQ